MKRIKTDTLIQESNDPTITFSELKRLSFCNSKSLPRKVIVNGQLRCWVGIGWISIDNSEATGQEPHVVE